MYWQRSPSSSSKPRLVPVKLPSGLVHLEADSGVFAYRGADPGTEALLKASPAPPDSGELLDLGCGYGPIAIDLAIRSPNASVWAVDVNERALALVGRNAQLLGLHNVHASAPEQVPPDVRFDALYANPPVRIGKTPMRTLVVDWLRRLKPDGNAYLVVKRSMGADSFAAWLSEQGWTVARLASKRGYRILHVSAAPSG